MNRIDSLSLFATLVDTGSFTAAARQLGVSTSSVSKQLSQLEARLGARLLNRSTRSLSLTEAGRTYYERGRKVLADVEDTEREIANLERTPTGVLRLLAAPLLGREALANIFAAFATRYPDVRLDVTLTNATFDLLREGADIAIHYGEVRDAPLIGKQVVSLSSVLCAAQAYALTHPLPDSVDDAGKHRWIDVVDADSVQPTGLRALHELDIAPEQVSVRVNDLDFALQACLAGSGIALLPNYTVARHLHTGRLVRVLPHIQLRGNPVYLLYAQSRMTSAKVKAFVEFVTALLDQTRR